MTEMRDTPANAASDLTWLLDGFRNDVHGVEAVLIVSTDGRWTHRSTGLRDEDAEHLAAVTSGAYSLMRGADAYLGGNGHVHQQVAQLSRHTFFVTSAAENSILAVITGSDADAGLVGHRMALLASQAGKYLGTETRTPDTAV
ncbi:roadblock/LC7 domain-containing protein (plasmid) [Streptomyces cellulosae]|uniref:roadblock/LC7 domain-containing protein n=1 Tax=Streptomyces cellulosae TaxID=1968 RepID=UPI002F908C11|nr:roadblock/LC7 domain-containing protein [Streptomyces cellulosae]